MSHSAPSQPHSHLASDWALIAIPGVIWGASFLFIAEGLKSAGPMGVTLVRIVVGFAALACFRGPGNRSSGGTGGRWCSWHWSGWCSR